MRCFLIATIALPSRNLFLASISLRVAGSGGVPPLCGKPIGCRDVMMMWLPTQNDRVLFVDIENNPILGFVVSPGNRIPGACLKKSPGLIPSCLRSTFQKPATQATQADVAFIMNSKPHLRCQSRMIWKRAGRHVGWWISSVSYYHDDRLLEAVISVHIKQLTGVSVLQWFSPYVGPVWVHFLLDQGPISSSSVMCV